MSATEKAYAATGAGLETRLAALEARLAEVDRQHKADEALFDCIQRAKAVIFSADRLATVEATLASEASALASRPDPESKPPQSFLRRAAAKLKRVLARGLGRGASQ